MVGTSPMSFAGSSAFRTSLTVVNILYIRAHSGKDLLGKLRVLLGKRWDGTVGESKHIVDDEHLPITLRPGANADCRYFQARRDASGKICGYGFQNDSEYAGLFENLRILHQPLGCLGIAALRTEATQLMHGLRGESEVSHYGNSDVDQPLRRLDDLASAFDLHSRRSTFLDQTAGIPHG